MQTNIWYEPHPVSAERKAELRSQGYKIIDAAFMPADHMQATEQTAQSVVQNIAWAKTPDGEYINLGDMSKEQLQALAKKHSVEVHHKSGVDKLIEALQSAFAKED